MYDIYDCIYVIELTFNPKDLVEENFNIFCMWDS